MKQKTATLDASRVPELAAQPELAHDQDLRELNHAWQFSPDRGIEPTGALGPLKRGVKGRIVNLVLSILLPYADRDEHFRAYVVRYANSVAARHDKIAEEVRRLAEAMRLEGERLEGRDAFYHELLEERVSRLEAELQARS